MTYPRYFRDLVLSLSQICICDCCDAVVTSRNNPPPTHTNTRLSRRNDGGERKCKNYREW